MASKLTIKDIAQMANTSKTTVSFFLNGKTNKMSAQTYDRIKKIIEATNFVPNSLARSLNSKKSHLIGVIIGDITNVFSNQLVKGLEDTASKNGYQIIMGNSNYEDGKEKNYIDQMIAMGVDGFVIQPTLNSMSNYKKIEKEGRPIVFIDSKLYEDTFNWVKANNRDSVYQALKACVQKGYQDFYLIGADPSMLSTRLERSQGFTDVMLEYGMGFKKMMIEDGISRPAQIKDFLQANIDLKKKSLIFVPNCWALHLVRQALTDYIQYIPQIGLLGFDNTEWTGYSSPTISTIVQPAYEEGRESAEILLKNLKHPSARVYQKVLNCRVNWLQSTDL